MPPIIDPGAINAVLENNLRLWVVDAEINSYNASVSKMKEIIINDKKNKISAVLIAHISGESLDFQSLTKLCKSKKIKIIEDCSQSHGAEIKKIKVGNFGDISAFSLMSRKTIAANGAAGMIYTKSKKLYNYCLAISDRGKPQWRRGYDARNPKFNLFSSLNYNLDEISCAIGSISLKKINSTVKKRRDTTMLLKNEINRSCKSVFVNYKVEGSSPFIIPVYVKNGYNKNKITKKLMNYNIPLNPNYNFLITNWNYLNYKIKGSDLVKTAKKNIKNSFALYINEKYTKKNVDYIVKKIIDIEHECRKI